MLAGSRTAKASNAITEVTNQAHVLKGIRANDIPLVRRSSVVAMKLSAPRSDAMQKIAIEIAHKVWPSFIPGPGVATHGAERSIGSPSGNRRTVA